MFQDVPATSQRHVMAATSQALPPHAAGKECQVSTLHINGTQINVDIEKAFVKSCVLRRLRCSTPSILVDAQQVM